MLEQYLLIAVVIILLWLLGFIAYLIISRRQRDLESDIQEISDMLGDDGV